jgi:nitrogen fixation protein FixH
MARGIEISVISAFLRSEDHMSKIRPRDFVAPTQEAAEAAVELAPKYDYQHFLRHDRSDGTIEVVVLENGVLNHYVVHASGMTELVQTLTAPARRIWGRRICLVGFALFPLIVAAGFVFQPENSDAWMGIPFAVATAMLFLSALIHRDHDLHAYVRNLTGSEDGWSGLPYRLGGWPARTTARLEAVRKLSDEGDGEAYVRDQHDGLVEVMTLRGRRRYRRLVDLEGVIVDEVVEPVPRLRRRSTRSMKAAREGGDDRWYTVRTAVPSD